MMTRTREWWPSLSGFICAVLWISRHLKFGRVQAAVLANCRPSSGKHTARSERGSEITVAHHPHLLTRLTALQRLTLRRYGGCLPRLVGAVVVTCTYARVNAGMQNAFQTRRQTYVYYPVFHQRMMTLFHWFQTCAAGYTDLRKLSIISKIFTIIYLRNKRP